jgi:DNA sulfur modification protein DndB
MTSSTSDAGSAGRRYFVTTCPLRLVPEVLEEQGEAIAEALRLKPELAEKSVPLVLLLDEPGLYGREDSIDDLAKRIAAEICPFCGLTQLEKPSLSNRSSKMFTLSAIRRATAAFLEQRPGELNEEEEALVLEFWTTIGELIRGWGFIGDGRTAGDLRDDYLHVHGISLRALGTVGGELTARHPESWQSRLRRLSALDWRRANPIWDGRPIRNGKISKSSSSFALMANLLRTRVGLELGPTELALEETLLKKEIRVAA